MEKRNRRYCTKDNLDGMLSNYKARVIEILSAKMLSDRIKNTRGDILCMK